MIKSFKLPDGHDHDDEEIIGTPSLLFKLTTNINMNVYVYGGNSRL
jgi:hypothetical protein